MNTTIISDYHLHSSFSGDSDSPMEDMIRSGIHEGLTCMCMTEHLDKDYPRRYHLVFDLDMEGYYHTYLKLKEKYQDMMDLRFGVELGLQPHLGEWHGDFVKKYPFDFIIGSSHLVRDIDPYEDEFYEGRTESEAYEEYFESILENLEHFTDIDVYGHIDYVVRYGPNKNREYSYARYADVIDAILHKLIDKGIGLECNTGGIKYGLGEPNPCVDALKRYRQLGGEILTIGSDAHRPEHVAYAFDQVPDILKACGYEYYTVFKNRKPAFIKLS